MKTNAAWLRANLTTRLPDLWSDANDLHKLQIVQIVAIESLLDGAPRTRALRKRPALGVPAGSRNLPAAPGAKRGIDRSARGVAGSQGVAA